MESICKVRITVRISGCEQKGVASFEIDERDLGRDVRRLGPQELAEQTADLVRDAAPSMVISGRFAKEG